MFNTTGCFNGKEKKDRSKFLTELVLQLYAEQQGIIAKVYTIYLTTDLDTRLSSCYMSRQLNEDLKLLTLNDVAGSWNAAR